MKTTILGMMAAGLLAATPSVNAGVISAAVSVVDFETPTQFAFTFISPITPLSGLNSYSFTGSITMTDAGRDGVTASPLSSAISPEFWRLEAGNGTTWSLVDDIGGTVPLSGAGPFDFTASGLFDCTALVECSRLRLSFAFGLSGGDDGLSGTGTFKLGPEAVPEPGTLLLIGLGLAGLGLGRRNKAH